MSKKDKLIKRLLSVPKDFTYQELKNLLESLGYIENTKGKTSGSRVQFEKGFHMIRLHKPHPEPVIKTYAIKQVIDELKKQGEIDEQ